MNPEIARQDLDDFSQPDPEVVAQMAKERAAERKAAERASKPLKAEQIKAAQKLTEDMKADQEAAEKSKLIQKLHDYVKHIREYYPERLEFVKAPKNFGPKNSIEELRVWVKDIENELGKKGSVDFFQIAWIKGFEFFEQLNDQGRFGLHVEGIGRAAVMQVTPRQLPDKTVVPGPVTPLLAELSIKYSSWFSSSVEARICLQALNMVAAVHRMNTEGINAQQAAQTKTNPTTSEKVKNL